VSGHSKWSTIKHKKAALDARRGRPGASLPGLSPWPPSMAAEVSTTTPPAPAIEKAKADNMPKDTIEKPSKRARASWRAKATRKSSTRATPGRHRRDVQATTTKPRPDRG